MLKVILRVSFILLSQYAFSQHVIQGRILSAKDSFPIYAASVILKGTNSGTSTDENGVFALIVQDTLVQKISALSLIFSALNFASKEISVRNVNDFLITYLKTDDRWIDEVIVTAKKDPKTLVSFPWPPPRCSSRYMIDRNYFKSAAKLKHVDSILRKTLVNCGYTDLSYYYVPNGFALVTRIEQIKEDGTPLDGQARWSIETDAEPISWRNYIRDILFTSPGFFRVIVFIITDQPFQGSEITIREEEAIKWLEKGLNALTERQQNIDFTSTYNCTALVYEFKKPESDDVKLITPGKILASQHLEKSKIINYLKQGL